MFRVVSEGQIAGNRIFDAATGEDVTRRLRASRITATIEGGRPPSVNLELAMSCKLDVTGSPRWYAANPLTGEVRELRALEFADGSRAELAASGSADSVAEVETSRA